MSASIRRDGRALPMGMKEKEREKRLNGRETVKVDHHVLGSGPAVVMRAGRRVPRAVLEAENRR